MEEKSGYGQFCPVAMTAQILTQRWMPLVIREILAGSHRFSDLQRGLPLISPSLLSARLKELEAAGIIERRADGRSRNGAYYATPAGEELRPIIEMFGFWAEKWLRRDYTEDELDPALLMWDIRRNVDGGAFPPDRRVVVEFELSGVKRGQRRWWLVFERCTADLCMKDPGHGVDLYVQSPIRTLTEVWMGRRDLGTALRSGEIALEGGRQDTRNFSNWFRLNFFATAKA